MGAGILVGKDTGGGFGRDLLARYGELKEEVVEKKNLLFREMRPGFSFFWWGFENFANEVLSCSGLVAELSGGGEEFRGRSRRELVGVEATANVPGEHRFCGQS